MTATQVAAPASRRVVERADCRPRLVLAAVCALHAIAPFVLMGSRLGLGADETVYLTQISRHIPPGYFSAPRARGLPILVAPITTWTASLFAIRLYLGILSGLGLYLAYCPW